MTNWEHVKAKDIVTFKTGKLDSNAAEEDGKYPFFTCAQTTYKINKFAFDTECVLLAGNNAAGIFPLKYYKGKFNAYQRTYVIESIDSERLNIKYFYFYLRPLLKSFEQQATGATTKFLTLQILINLDIALPTKDVQKKIAAILSAYDDLIENNKRRIALLEKMAEEIYREWFVRMRFPGHEKVKFEKGVPEGWEVKRFRDIVKDYIGGGWGEEIQSATFSDGAYIIRGTDIPKLNSGELQNEVYRYHKPSNLKPRRLKAGDFVFEVSGGSKDQLLGRNLHLTEKLLNYFDNNVMCASFCKLIRFNGELVSPYFMKYYMKLYYDYDLGSVDISA